MVPGHWHISKLKHFTHFAGGGTPSRDKVEFWNGNIPWVSPKDMKSERITGAEECITEEGLLGSSSSLIAKDRVLMVVRSGILKHTIPVAINDVPVALNQDMKALTFEREKCLGSFFWRWVQGLNDRLLLAWSKPGATVDSIEHDYLAETRIPLPPIDEQLQITLFLGRETTKIDNLMAEQEKLIALLKEKRQAVIAHAVTKGLEPTAQMKDSGVEWLGEVPSHWEVSQLKHVAQDGTSITYGIVQAGPHVEGGIPYIKTSDMSGESLPLEGYSRTSSEIDLSYSRSKVFFGDLVIAIRASVGKCLPLPEELDGANLTQGTAKISPGECVERDYLLHLINSAGLQIYFDSMAKGATFKEITLDMLRRTPVLIPPLAEQRNIARYLSTELKSFQNLLQETEKAISLLKERRTALISAAVTGQIDVRGLVREEQEQAA